MVYDMFVYVTRPTDVFLFAFILIFLTFIGLSREWYTSRIDDGGDGGDG